MKRLFFCFLFFITIASVYAQDDTAYRKAYRTLTNMLQGREPLNFKRAVFVVENAYHDEELDYAKYCRIIHDYARFCERIGHEWELYYPEKDTEVAAKQAAVYAFMTDSIPIQIDDNNIAYNLPFRYNLDDYAGEKDWTNMFVTTLMGNNKQGNCHSLPMLYKMILEELGGQAWIAIAPNHFYIKTYNKRAGWYNIELTGGGFPTDAWVVASGYIHTDAIRSGIYMDTLSQQQSGAVCLTDLAMGYERKFEENNTAFVLQCCQTALEYYPNYINALLLKAETLYKLHKETANDSKESSLQKELNELYSRIHELGYRKMPRQMYMNWLLSLQEQKENFQNKKITIFEK